MLFLAGNNHSPHLRTRFALYMVRFPEIKDRQKAFEELKAMPFDECDHIYNGYGCAEKCKEELQERFDPSPIQWLGYSTGGLTEIAITRWYLHSHMPSLNSAYIGPLVGEYGVGLVNHVFERVRLQAGVYPIFSGSGPGYLKSLCEVADHFFPDVAHFDRAELVQPIYTIMDGLSKGEQEGDLTPVETAIARIQELLTPSAKPAVPAADTIELE